MGGHRFPECFPAPEHPLKYASLSLLDDPKAQPTLSSSDFSEAGSRSMKGPGCDANWVPPDSPSAHRSSFQQGSMASCVNSTFCDPRSGFELLCIWGGEKTPWEGWEMIRNPLRFRKAFPPTVPRLPDPIWASSPSSRSIDS